MNNKKLKQIRVIGKKGGDDSPDPPVEEPNTLRSRATARLVDLLCEGEINGPANGTWEKSIYFNEIPIKDSSGNSNFEGVNVVARDGTSNQRYLRGFDEVESETVVNTQVTKSGGAISQVINDDEVDDVRITLQVPTLLEQETNGDIVKARIDYRITITPNGGSEQKVIDSNIYGKTTSTYQKQHVIEDLNDYGAAPWTIKVYRDTDDSGSAKLINNLFWYSYTEIKNIKLRYMDRAVVGIRLNAQEFGNRIPYRAYKIEGRRISVPSNYNATARTYSGNWDGTFKTAYSNNPAWVVYDILTNDRFGVGLDATQVDKWTLYTIGEYCDGSVTVTTKERQSDGSYSSSSSTEPRFTFNGVIQNRAEALAVINHLTSVFRGFPIWATGQVSFVQDSPKTVRRVASPANVQDGVFEYQSSPKQARHTAIKISYNNPDNFGKLETLVVEDIEGITKYGYNPIDVVAFGCNSRSEATRRAKYMLYTDINQTETVQFRGGLEWADALPGDLIAVQDPEYAGIEHSGRVISGTTTSITVDRDIEIEGGVTYTLYVQCPSGDSAERTLNNLPAAASNVLTWSSPLTTSAPEADMVWAISSSNVATRQFLITGINEVDTGIYEIQGALYDSNKYAEVEDGIVVEPAQTIVYQEELDPPSNIDIQPYTYTEGDQNLRKYGMVISWEASTDPRTDIYQLRYKFNNQDGWVSLGTTTQLFYDFQGAQSGTYDISIRARGVVSNSRWVTIDDFTLTTVVSTPNAPTGLQVKGGGSTFNGPNCQIEWTGSVGSTYTDGYVASAGVGDDIVNYYKVEVYKIDDTLLRTYETASKEEKEYIYLYDYNYEDNSNVPIRQLKFKVYAVDMYGNESPAATLVAENPAPDMSSVLPTVNERAAHLAIEWSQVNDNDMDFYYVYIDTNNPPTSRVAKIVYPDQFYNFLDCQVGTKYYVRIRPYDKFGAGVPSQVADGIPSTIPNVNVQEELTGSIEITDIDGNDAATLKRLYDRYYSTNGLLYTVSTSGGDKWIQYAYKLENYFDKIGVWTADSNAKVYIAYSLDGTDWDYLKAKSDHTLGGDDSDELLFANNQSDARTNYWQLSSGKNTANWPNNITAEYVRLYITGDYSTTIYEIIPSRILISELAAIEHLSSITADIGLINAGILRSQNYIQNVSGLEFDLDNSELNIYDPSGLIIKSTGGMDVEGDFNVKSGGDITVEGGGGINVFSGGSVVISGGGDLTVKSTGDIIIEDGGDLTIEDGGQINLNAGADITLTGDDSDPAYLIFSGAYDYRMGTDQSSALLALYPTTAQQGSFYIGREEDSSYNRFNHGYFAFESSFTLDVDGNDCRMQYNPGQMIFRVDDGVGDITQLNLKAQGSGTDYIEVAAGDVLRPQSHKSVDLGESGKAWDEAYADNWNNVADFLHLDTFDDVEIINNIKPSGEIDEKTGLPLIDDNTLPDWMLVKHKKDGKEEVTIYKCNYCKEEFESNLIPFECPLCNEENNFENKGTRTIRQWKKGDVALDTDGKPYLSLKVPISLVMGAIRQIDKRIKNLERIYG